MFVRVFTFIAALLFAGCGYDPTARLLGAWEGREADGTRTIMVFEKGGKLTVIAGYERGRGTYLIHPNTAPLHIDLDFQLGPTRIIAKSLLVFLSADQLKLAQPKRERPADFSEKVILLDRRVP